VLHSSESNRQVLNRQSRRVEDGRFIVAAPSLGVAGEYRAQLCDVFTFELPGLERMDELTVVTRLLLGVNKRNILNTLRSVRTARLSRRC
jgi:hypothetical protein